eukprot:CAMPEP_0116939164 /NCGR_PEP_ID=MMETSP0467-20121206/32572_1 /TAXON_ID=283647 /ORGANISM="Mesodinium pulex, Strain SPMC105" /LENGTH=73 /DNA_ID=CAMNT_0004621389 /DNA_START=395 /DNA_END=616 /DNA_ORIENTATION=+
MSENIKQTYDISRMNLDQILKENENINTTNAKADDLKNLNEQLLRNTRKVKNQKMCEYYRWWIIGSIVALVVI